MSRSPRRLAGLLAAASLAAAPHASTFAGAQLYKCVDGGRTVYQQQACSPSAQPEAATSAAAKASAPNVMAKASAPGADAAAVAPRKVRTPSSPASSALATPR